MPPFQPEAIELKSLVCRRRKESVIVKRYGAAALYGQHPIVGFWRERSWIGVFTIAKTAVELQNARIRKSRAVVHKQRDTLAIGLE